MKVSTEEPMWWQFSFFTALCYDYNMEVPFLLSSCVAIPPLQKMNFAVLVVVPTLLPTAKSFLVLEYCLFFGSTFTSF